MDKKPVIDESAMYRPELEPDYGKKQSAAALAFSLWHQPPLNAQRSKTMPHASQRSDRKAHGDQVDKTHPEGKA